MLDTAVLCANTLLLCPKTRRPQKFHTVTLGEDISAAINGQEGPPRLAQFTRMLRAESGLCDVGEDRYRICDEMHAST